MSNRVLLLLGVGILTAGCNSLGQPATVGQNNSLPPPAVATQSRGVQVGMTVSQMKDFLGKPERIYGAGTPVAVYPLPNNVLLKIGISGLDNQSKVLWIKKVDAMGLPAS